MLVSSGGEYPTITLTARGEEIMKGTVDYTLRWPQRAAVAATSRLQKTKTKSRTLEQLLPPDEALFEELKKVRIRLAREQGNLPAYMIFPDETLRAFARLKPRSAEAGQKICGVGDLKAKRYLSAFLEAIDRQEKNSSGRA